MEGGTMRGDERVGPFRDGRETGQMAVESEPESFAGRVAERQETGLGGAGAALVGGDILHRPPELGFRYGGILRHDLLIGPVFDLIAGQLLPVAGPIGAEPTIPVIDEPRARAQGWRVSGVGRRIFGVLWHDIRDDWRRVYPRRAFSGTVSIYESCAAAPSLRRLRPHQGVVQDRPEPALDFGDGHALAGRIVLDLV